MQSLWKINKPLQQGESITDKILLRRNIFPQDFPACSGQDIKQLSSPYMYTDMKKSVERILQAQKCEEKILIYGDYDVDGITSTALLFEYFTERLELDTTYYLPNRFRDGYGLNEKALRKLNAADFDLILTVDCGITAFEEIEFINDLGTDVIVTDHHRAKSKYPRAISILNPSCADKMKDQKEKLAGVGVAFKLCQALEQELHDSCFTEYLISQLDLVALGSIADLISLRGENRILVTRGLEILANKKRPGLKKIMEKVGLKKCHDLTAGKVSFILAPPFNAAGRLKSPDLGLQLLLAKNEDRVESLAEELISLNNKRRKLEEKIWEEAEQMLSKSEIDKKEAPVLASENWHQGVIGIVASNLVDKYNRPAILIALEGEEGKGSARSISGFDLYRALENCAGHLKNYGGHSQAAGLTIKKKNISDFREEFNSYFAKSVSSRSLIPSKQVDALLSEKEISRILHDDIQQLRPFGVGNPQPVFMTGGVKLRNARRVGRNNKHLKIKTKSGNSGIGFNLGDKLTDFDDFEGKSFSLLYNLDLNNWRGKENLQLKIKNILPEDEKHNIPVVYQQEDFVLYDARGGDKETYVRDLQKWNGSSALYLHSLKKRDNLKNKYPDVQILTSLEEFSTCNNRLILWGLPFSMKEIAYVLNKLTSKGVSPEIHLIFSREDLELNRSLIDKRLPDKRQITEVWQRFLTQKEMEFDNSFRKEFTYSKKAWNEIIRILLEINVITEAENSYLIADKTKNLDLSVSMRYNEIVDIRRCFNKLEQKINSWDLRPFIKALIEQKN